MDVPSPLPTGAVNTLNHILRAEIYLKTCKISGEIIYLQENNSIFCNTFSNLA